MRVDAGGEEDDEGAGVRVLRDDQLPTEPQEVRQEQKRRTTRGERSGEHVLRPPVGGSQREHG